MGAQTLQPLSQLFSTLFQGSTGARQAQLADVPALARFHPSDRAIARSNGLPALLRPADPAALGTTPAAAGDPAGQVNDQFNTLTYSSQFTKVSLVAQYQQVAARIAAVQGDGQDAQTAQVDAQQLKFSFFAEAKSEQLTLFNQRTAAVADGLNGGQKESYLATSQRIAAQFSLSVDISGAALSGFTGASEALNNGSGSGIDQLTGLTKDLLDKANALFNQVFELFQGLAANGTPSDFEKKFNEILNTLQSVDLSGLFSNPLGQLTGPQSAQTAAGTGTQVQAFGVSVQLEFKFEYSSTEVTVQKSDPITLDLNGNGVNLSSYLNGAQFDITGSGQLARTAFVTGGDAFLALDRNGNNTIDSGKELFGDQNGATNGYEELRKLDSNHDGRITPQDDAYHKLLLFKDNGNGKTDPGELVSLRQAGIVEISLAYQNVSLRAAGGNSIGQIGAYTRADGSRGLAADTVLNYTA